jgi:hypothetical protein
VDENTIKGNNEDSPPIRSWIRTGLPSALHRLQNQ